MFCIPSPSVGPNASIPSCDMFKSVPFSLSGSVLNCSPRSRTCWILLSSTTVVSFNVSLIFGSAAMTAAAPNVTLAAKSEADCPTRTAVADGGFLIFAERSACNTGYSGLSFPVKSVYLIFVNFLLESLANLVNSDRFNLRLRDPTGIFGT